ncbi:TPA: hypothetical protein ACWOMT_004895, partial [Escherichia coli]
YAQKRKPSIIPSNLLISFKVSVIIRPYIQTNIITIVAPDIQLAWITKSQGGDLPFLSGRVALNHGED